MYYLPFAEYAEGLGDRDSVRAYGDHRPSDWPEVALLAASGNDWLWDFLDAVLPTRPRLVRSAVFAPIAPDRGPAAARRDGPLRAAGPERREVSASPT